MPSQFAIANPIGNDVNIMMTSGGEGNSHGDSKYPGTLFEQFLGAGKEYQ